jgi:hypothetical protein
VLHQCLRRTDNGYTDSRLGRARAARVLGPSRHRSRGRGLERGVAAALLRGAAAEHAGSVGRMRARARRVVAPGAGAGWGRVPGAQCRGAASRASAAAGHGALQRER